MALRVAVAMSGGVDSSVAACLLKQQGFDIFGITMDFGIRKGSAPNKNIIDAKRVCAKLGIKHYVVNLKDSFKGIVIKDFLNEYLSGKTPNPCVKCNQYIKFGILINNAKALGADKIATGHYARIVHLSGSKTRQQEYLLKKAGDLSKDQSYFLYRLSQAQLKNIIFPLAGFTKQQVRELAVKFKLPVAKKADSQEICFLANSDYRDFLKKHIPQALKKGLITDEKANVLGQHNGIAFYTIGQRQGLGVSRGYPLYINRIDVKKNQLVVGTREQACKKSFLIKKAHFILGPIKKKVALKVRIRYNHKEALADILPLRGRCKVVFRKAQFAITPGQSAVFYDKDTVVGGGFIERVIS
ncbi:MAG: tRNA 2-thiouridine(34) synthase MnmA [Candidatus Omnitrophica bacterium]|nr:tRNA 2-thiouridine(34) synthase MnmA [Candidatus Omnitrophota bacterium]